MRKIALLVLGGSLSFANMFAQNGTGFIGNGYYRVCNYKTERYIYVTDNKDYYDKSRDAEDFQAIQLWKDPSRAVSDPGSVIYMEEVSSGNFDLKAQGTGVHSLTGYYVSVKKQRNGTYEVSASAHGVTKYLSDDEQSNTAQGKMGTSGTNDYRKWAVDKITTDHATNYVGITPTIELDGLYYQPFYASFPFKAASPDMNIYYINDFTGNYATMEKIEGDVPAATPVLIECKSNDPSQNRIELLISSSAKASGNLLSGVYFCNGSRPAESKDAYTTFEAATMRVFDVADGRLVLTNQPQSGRLGQITQLVWDDDSWTYKRKPVDCIAANTSYLKTSAGTAEEITVVLPGMGINDINKENNPFANGIYSISGKQLRQTNDTEGLPAGLYIVGSKKIVIK